jgi:hypothetical protein
VTDPSTAVAPSADSGELEAEPAPEFVPLSRETIAWRRAAALFAVVELVALVGILQYARDWWFFYDEWDFLAHRKAGSLHDLFAPHIGHWVTVPILVYRGLWQVFGLRHYWPYLGITVVLHLTLAALLVVMMKRCGVRPTIAIAAGSLFVFFAPGFVNIAWAFQMTIVGSVVFGYVQLLCATQPGPLARRDWLGLGAGFVGLMCSGIALPMIVFVGVATYLRRGARIAAFHVVPLVVTFAIWYEAIGKKGNVHVHSGIATVLHYTVHGLGAAFTNLSIQAAPIAWHIPNAAVDGAGHVITWMLGAMLVVGSALAWRGRWRRDCVPLEVAVPIASLVAMVAFLLISGWGRSAWLGISTASTSRYLHLYAAFLLVPLAVAAEAITRRWKWFVFAALALFLIAIPGNVTTFISFEHHEGPRQQVARGEVLWIPRLRGVRALPPGLQPEPLLAAPMTLGWLINATKDGKLPPPPQNSFERRYARDLVNNAEAVYAAKHCRQDPGACVKTPAAKP